MKDFYKVLIAILAVYTISISSFIYAISISLEEKETIHVVKCKKLKLEKIHSFKC